MTNPLERAEPKTPQKNLPWWKRSFIQRLFLLLATATLAASLWLSMGFSPLAHAAIQSALTCAQNPITERCQSQDPVVQGCTADAQTVSTLEIQRQGVDVGLLEMRHSDRCKSLWVRCTSLSQGFANLYMLSPYTESINGTFRGKAQGAYTDMAFGALFPTARCVIAFSASVAPSATIGGAA